MKTIGKVRMSIYNKFSNQEPFYHTDPSHQHSLSHPPSWTLRIEGRLLEEVISHQLTPPIL